jgi:hypothetical protein
MMENVREFMIRAVFLFETAYTALKRFFLENMTSKQILYSLKNTSIILKRRKKNFSCLTIPVIAQIWKKTINSQISSSTPLKKRLIGNRK